MKQNRKTTIHVSPRLDPCSSKGQKEAYAIVLLEEVEIVLLVLTQFSQNLRVLEEIHGILGLFHQHLQTINDSLTLLCEF